MSEFILSAFADEIDMDLSLQISELKQHDIGYIEIRGVNGKNISDYTVEEIQAVKKQLDENGMKISALGSPFGKININDSFDEHFEKFKNGVELAKALDTKYIRMFSFFITDGSDPASHRDEVMRRLRLMVDYAAQHDIILLHENEKDIYGDIPERCADIFETINSPYLKATFDPANFVQVDVKPVEAYNILRKYVEYFHIKDAKFSDKSIEPAGKGDGEILTLLKALDAENYKGFLSIEPHLANFAGLSDFELDDRYEKLEKAGPKTFAIAVYALKNLIAEV